MNRFLRVVILLALAALVTGGGLVIYQIRSLPDVSSLASENFSTTAFIEYRKQQAQIEGRSFRLRHKWVATEDIPLTLERTIVVAEDASFWVHDGFDWYEVRQAFLQNLREGKVVRGASTITQQTAKNLFLSPQRSIFRKVQEYFLAREMEERLSKQRILELYLNCIEFGEGVFGIGSAAEFYFQKTPAQLRIDEMVRLAGVIPSPLRLRPDRPSGELRRRSRSILRRLIRYGFITESEFQEAQAELQYFFSGELR